MHQYVNQLIVCSEWSDKTVMRLCHGHQGLPLKSQKQQWPMRTKTQVWAQLSAQ